MLPIAIAIEISCPKHNIIYNLQFHLKSSLIDIYLKYCIIPTMSYVSYFERDNDDITINYANSDGLTALHSATIDGNSKMVKYLLSKGADINVQGAFYSRNSKDQTVFRS